MKPNIMLEMIRNSIAAMERAEHENDEGAFTSAAEKLAEAFNDLDIWLVRGGALPTLWERDVRDNSTV